MRGESWYDELNFFLENLIFSMYPFEKLILYLLSTATSKANLRLNLMEQVIAM